MPPPQRQQETQSSVIPHWQHHLPGGEKLLQLHAVQYVVWPSHVTAPCQPSKQSLSEVVHELLPEQLTVPDWH